MSAPVASSAASVGESSVASSASAVSASAASAGGSRSNRNRKRKNKQNQNNAAAPAASHPQHGGHSHGGGGHSHSHGGAPCGGHGDPHSMGAAPSHSHSPFGDVDPDSMQEAIHYCDVCWHYQSYRTHTFQRLERMQSDFTVIPTVLQQLIPSFDSRMQQLRQAVVANYAFIQEILAHRYVFHNTPDIDYESLEERVARDHPVDEERMGRVRSTLRQCVRDWSSEGANERAACYGPILAELDRIYPTMESRVGVRVLVPGSGLGRLVWEVANHGFHATGNEFSYFMLMGAFLILNSCKAPNIFTIYPYVHESKNLLDPSDQLRSVQVPDVDPTQLPAQGRLNMAAGDWMDIFSDLPGEYLHGMYARKTELARQRLRTFQEKQRQWAAERKKREEAIAAARKANKPIPTFPDMPIEEEAQQIVADAPRTQNHNENKESWDAIATCYFIDCAQNILEFIRTIAYLLKDGGHWINFGPLLYHFSDVPENISVDLSWNELRRAIPYFGLQLERESFNNPSSYTSDERSMLRQHYFCVACTWVKVGEDVTSKPNLRIDLAEPTSTATETRALTGSDDQHAIVAIDENEPTLTSFLTKSHGKLVRSTKTPNGVAITVWQLPAAKVAPFLLRAMDVSEVNIGKIVVEQIEMMAAIKKK